MFRMCFRNVFFSVPAESESLAEDDPFVQSQAALDDGPCGSDGRFATLGHGTFPSVSDAAPPAREVSLRCGIPSESQHRWKHLIRVTTQHKGRIASLMHTQLCLAAITSLIAPFYPALVSSPTSLHAHCLEAAPKVYFFSSIFSAAIAGRIL